MTASTRYKASDSYNREQITRLENYKQLPPSPEWVKMREDCISRGIYNPTKED